MPAREKSYVCVGGPFDGLRGRFEVSRVRLSTVQDIAAGAMPDGGVPPPLQGEVFDYDVRRLLAPDGKWYEFLVLSSWTSMQATAWLNRRRQ